MALTATSRRLTGELRSFLATTRFDPSGPAPADTTWPKITIVTPSYNQADYLERTILSIHNQQYPNLEHIVIDGGSDDGSVEIIRKYQGVLAHWQSEPDEGQCDAINKGGMRATGHLMTWINSDDLLWPGALREVGSHFRARPQSDVLFGNQLEVDARDRVTKRVYTIDFDIRDFLFESNIIAPQQSTFWRSDLFRSLGGLSGCPYAMDYEFFYRVYRSGGRFTRLQPFLSAFRVYGESLTGSGEVSRNRDATLDGVFRDWTGRDRGPTDRVFRQPYWKIRRFLAEPRTLPAAVENRLYRLLDRLQLAPHV